MKDFHYCLDRRKFSPYDWSSNPIFFLGPFDHLFQQREESFMSGGFLSNPFANPAAQLLVVEGNADELFFMKRALSKAGLLGQSTFARDAAQMIEYLLAGADASREVSPALPKLILIDPATPTLVGFEVLHWLRNQAGLAQVPVVVFTALEDPHKRNRALGLGVEQYRMKDPDVSLWPDTLLELAMEYGL